jgi:hypothetical protein
MSTTICAIIIRSSEKREEKLVTCICSTPLSSKEIKSCGFNLTIDFFLKKKDY